MDYELIEDVTHADVAVRVKAASYDELFVKGGRAVICEMVENHGDISRDVERSGNLSGADIDMLYFEFLNEIIFLKDAEQLLLLPETVHIAWQRGEYSCAFKLSGEKIKRDKHIFKVDIKAATMHGLAIYERGGLYIAETVFDV